jgi:hypothetical protein
MLDVQGIAVHVEKRLNVMPKSVKARGDGVAETSSGCGRGRARSSKNPLPKHF